MRLIPFAQQIAYMQRHVEELKSAHNMGLHPQIAIAEDILLTLRFIKAEQDAQDMVDMVKGFTGRK